MASESGGAGASLIDRLRREAHRFDFFQAVRILERHAVEEARQNPRERRFPVGQDCEPSREVVRFKALQSQSFATSAVVELREAPGDAETRGSAGGPPPEMVVSFMGLTGPSGVLPFHYSRLLIGLAREKDCGPRDFLDIFNHRLISLFFRAWEKYRVTTAYERARLDPSVGEDPFSRCTFSLAGLGTGGLRHRLAIDDEAFLCYAGLFADGRRSAAALERMVSEYFEIPVSVVQFQGQWLPLQASDRTALCSSGAPGSNNALGVDAVVGDKVWSRQSKFRVRIGPLPYHEYVAFLPKGATLSPLSQMVRMYAGSDLDFDVEVEVKAAEVPPLRLRSEGEYEPLLGWTTWLVSRTVEEEYKSTVFPSKEPGAEAAGDT